MTEADNRRTMGIVAPTTEEPATWTEFLKARIAEDWRPGQFDFGSLVFTPVLNDPHTTLTKCVRLDCGILLHGGDMCPICRREWKAVTQETGIGKEEWAATNARIRVDKAVGCRVDQCERDHRNFGLCATHGERYAKHAAKAEGPYTVEDWIRDYRPRPLPPRKRCLAQVCRGEAVHRFGLCGNHNVHYQRWLRKQRLPIDDTHIDLWLSREIEPLLQPLTGKTYAQVCATPFGLLPEPLRWEFLYVVQKRDLQGRSKLWPVRMRGTYLQLRRSGLDSVVGLPGLGREAGTDANLAGMLAEWQRHLDDAYREWSGTDDRDSKVIYLSDLELRATTKTIGPRSRMDLSGIQQEWIVDTVSAWARGAARGADTLNMVARAWTVADEVLRVRGTARHALGVADMDAIVKAVRARWTGGHTQGRVIKAIDRVIKYARRDDALQSYWGAVPGRFAVDLTRHRPVDQVDTGSADADEPFRFVPQPIVDWIMDRLHLIDRGDAYLTAESRAMLYVHERCGRRTGETVRLLDDCISYDNQGSPYLEWRRGKPPYGQGKRLPIHQETHDLIRQWQEIKRERGITSKWLFPSLRYTTADRPYDTKHLNNRLRDLIDAVCAQAPYEGTVEGADGNLIYFDLTTIDPYSFRHAFAQRLADATDADGRPTTPPDVLQDYMGHKNFNTTMVYYQVTAKRRKKALEAIPPRRLNLHGEVLTVDRERDGFTRIAVSLGHCSEPQNVAAGGHGCMIDHACESCPFFMVDPLERDGMEAKRHDLRVKLERARVIQSPQHLLDHYTARIEDCTRIIDGIDAYVDALPDEERETIREALEHMGDIRARATRPRRIDLRMMLAKVA